MDKYTHAQKLIANAAHFASAAAEVAANPPPPGAGIRPAFVAHLDRLHSDHEATFREAAANSCETAVRVLRGE